jgi:predicted RNA-binding Zn ribbon-like protein
MTEAGAHEVSFELVGGELCLDFVNTLDGSRDTGNGRETLTSYADLVAWGRQAGIVTDGEAKGLLREAARRPREAAEALEQAIALRETIYRIFRAVINERSPGKADLAALNAALSRALAQSQVVKQGESFVWDWSRNDDAMDRLLWPVARSAAELLTSAELSRARQCGGDECTWLFMDTSKNRSRRWCDMKGCGNRAKSRRHYERKKLVNSE